MTNPAFPDLTSLGIKPRRSPRPTPRPHTSNRLPVLFSSFLAQSAWKGTQDVSQTSSSAPDLDGASASDAKCEQSDDTAQAGIAGQTLIALLQTGNQTPAPVTAAVTKDDNDDAAAVSGIAKHSEMISPTSGTNNILQTKELLTDTRAFSVDAA